MTRPRQLLLRLLLLPLVTALCACGDRGPSLAERAAATRASQDAADAKAREASRAQAEERRLLALWSYQQATVGGADQVTAAIIAADGVDTDGTGARPVQLVFRDHKKWGRSAYLVLKAGDFKCRPACAVKVSVDNRTPESLAAWRPNTDEAIAIFIRDTKKMWRLAGDATRLSIEFPITAGGTRTASFEVVGLDEAKMPGW